MTRFTVTWHPEMQGLLAGWDYRTAIGVSRNKATADVKHGYLNDDLIQQGVFNGIINPTIGLTCLPLCAGTQPTSVLVLASRC